MKLEHFLLSILVTFGTKCYTIITSCSKYLPEGPTLILFVVCCGLILTTRTFRTEGSPSQTLLISKRDILSASVVGIISVIYLKSTSPYEERLRLFRERNKAINDFYDIHPDQYVLSPCRTIPQSSVRYEGGQWVIFNQDENCSSEESSVLRFRGINLPAKTPSDPSNLRNTRNATNFYESKRNVSFIGCPFSLAEAPKHFKRMSHHWGLNLLRLSVPWEAVMHEGPGILDQSYLSYLKELVSLAGKFGLYVIIDPHQDVWSRFTGGDGAPWWTLDAAGFITEDSALHDTGAAVLHQFWNSTEYGDMPRMMWTTNYWKLAAATMFTLFFGGDDYAPGIVVDSMKLPSYIYGSETVTIQQFLQGHYLDYIEAVANAVKECSNVIGFGVMNEPSVGLIGISDLNEILAPTLHGHVLSTFDSMRLGIGDSLKVPFYTSHFYFDSVAMLNPNGRSVYKSSEHDIWKKVGVYDINTHTNEFVILRPDHFLLGDGKNFNINYLLPFYDLVRGRVTRSDPRFITYAEPVFDPIDPYPSAPTALLEHFNANEIAWAPHWYDAVTLFFERYSHWISFDFEWRVPILSPLAIDFEFKRYLKCIKGVRGNRQLPHPTSSVIIGETGVPFLDDEYDYSRALHRTLKAIESVDLDYIIWTYEAGSNKVDGDRWNNENLSLLSTDKSRGLLSAVRPYPFQYSQGLEIILQEFDPFRAKYNLEILDSMNCSECTATVKLFVPSCHFKGAKFVAAGQVIYSQASQCLLLNIYRRTAGSIYSLTINVDV